MRLPFTRVRDWRSRWVQLGQRSTLHRVLRVEKSLREWRAWPYGPGETVCGLQDENVHMPGFISRLAAKRCPKCCKFVGIPSGVGAPFNDPTLFPPEGRALRSQP